MNMNRKKRKFEEGIELSTTNRIKHAQVLSNDDSDNLYRKLSSEIQAHHLRTMQNVSVLDLRIVNEDCYLKGLPNPLYLAIEADNCSAAVLLLQIDDDIEIVYEEENHDDNDVISHNQRIKEYGKAHTDLKDSDNKTALFWAATISVVNFPKQIEMVKLLLDAGADDRNLIVKSTGKSLEEMITDTEVLNLITASIDSKPLYDCK